MLRWVGCDHAALLDGGLKAWIDEESAISTEPASRPARRLTPSPRPELIADRDEVLAAIDDSHVWLIDTLPEAYYRGETTLYHRPGHIPGASNICSLDLLDESGHFRPQNELADMHQGDTDDRTITYCGGGIMASANAFIMSRLGYNNVAVYTASLQEWATDPSNPMVVYTE